MLLNVLNIYKLRTFVSKNILRIKAFVTLYIFINKFTFNYYAKENSSLSYSHIKYHIVTLTTILNFLPNYSFKYINKVSCIRNEYINSFCIHK
jgi:hypothetical protein